MSSKFPLEVPLEFMNYVMSIKKIVRHFKWKTYLLMGHSYGGHISSTYAAMFSKEVCFSRCCNEKRTNFSIDYFGGLVIDLPGIEMVSKKCQ